MAECFFGEITISMLVQVPSPSIMAIIGASLLIDKLHQDIASRVLSQSLLIDCSAIVPRERLQKSRNSMKEIIVPLLLIIPSTGHNDQLIMALIL